MSTLKSLANPIKELETLGQSVWLDYIRRSLLTSGELKRLVAEDGLRGVTSNPAIFEKAIGGSSDYDAEIKSIVKGAAGKIDSSQVFEKLAVKDIQDAADALRPVYDETKGRDGYISLEVSPFLAYETEKTISDAKRLWKEVNRPNLMIKVPATPQGIPAIKDLISNGINVNVTLLFAQAKYEQVAEAYISGLEKLAASGGDVSKVASVASFFVSRIDSMIDTMIEAKLKATGDAKEQALLHSVEGKVAIANAKLTYSKYHEIYATPRWQALAAKGARTQRLLWASTSTKNPNYPDTIYVDELIGPDTVNTIPPATFDAFRDHGKPKVTLTEGLEEAKVVMSNLAKIDISMEKVTDELLVQGVDLFADAFKKLLATVDKQLETGPRKIIDGLKYKLPKELDDAVKAALKDWQTNGKAAKLWNKDASLWTNEDEAKWLDWLNITSKQLESIDHLKKIAEDVKNAGFKHALLLGMGGSSLCPEVMEKTFGKGHGQPQLHVLDSTDPAQVVAREKEVELDKCIFIVSSKSGSTLEPNIYKQFFWDKVSQKLGTDKVGDRFIAITDPGSRMNKIAESENFRHIYFGLPGIGGRYSALSDFGMVPAAILGVDVEKFLDNAEEMVQACAATVPVQENPGIVLGAIMGAAAKSGRDKLTLITSPAIYDLGAWLEQLLAESTGKLGKGIIPVDREEIGSPDVYGKDRLFAYIRLESNPDAAQDKAVEALEAAGQPVIRISVPDIYYLGEEMFRWEIATAVAGSIIGINAFNQPDVEASKIATRQLTDEYEQNGSLPAETPIFEADGIKLYTDKKNADALNAAVGADKTLAGYVRAHLNRISAGDYFALLAYIEMTEHHEQDLQAIRHPLRDKKKVATCLGFGPRFLHSTGQAYKGGPNSGVFLQVTCDDKADVPVPGQKYTFGVVKAAQARGDFQVLAERGRRALRVHLGADVKAGLAKLKEAVDKALS